MQLKEQQEGKLKEVAGIVAELAEKVSHLPCAIGPISAC